MKGAKKPADPEVITAKRILGLLRERHSDQEWSFFAELATSGSSDNSRYIDAFAMNLWASKKFRRIAYEIKVSRSDLMKELDRVPEKRDAAMEVSNQFFYVCPNGLVTKKELPDNCGLIEANKGGLRVKVAAKYREIDPPTHAFVARMIQRMQGYEIAPVPCFKYAGREMTEEEFRQFTRDSMSGQMKLDIDDGVQEGIDRWKKNNQVVEIIRYLRKESRHSWGGGRLDELKEWIEGIRKGVPIKDLRWIADSMRDLQDPLRRILDKIPEEKDPDDDDEETEEFHIGLEGEANPVQGSPSPSDSGGSEDTDEEGGDPPAEGKES